MKKVFALVSLIWMMFFSLNTQAQKSTQDQVEPIPERKNYSKHGIGAVLSSSNGKGLAYRYWPKTYGIQVSFIPVASNSEEYYNVGLTGYARLKKYSVGELFVHVGAEYQYQTFERYDYYSYSSSYYESYNVISNGINVGFGPGYHFELKPISFDLFLGYGAYLRDESSDKPYADLNDRRLMTVSGGFAVFLNI
jgi:hypothetical protein